jgi:hypothetical protein
MTTTGIHGAVAVGDPDAPSHVIKPNADGSVNIVGGAGDGGPVSVADGADVALGAKADAAVFSPAATATLISLFKGLLSLVNGEYETVAASQTAQVLGATGATGDYLSGILVIPATTSPGEVTLLDNATSIPVFVGGATSVSTLIPFFVQIGAKSTSGAWKLTTGTNVSAIGIGNFT